MKKLWMTAMLGAMFAGPAVYAAECKAGDTKCQQQQQKPKPAPKDCNSGDPGCFKKK